MTADQLGDELERIRPDLDGYLRRLLAAPDAEDVFQNTAVRALRALASAPSAAGELRPWLFRIATNLALDELRRRGRWREETIVLLRERAERDERFVSFSSSLRGAESMRLVAKEHLVACFACTLRSLSPERSAALLLREVHGFAIDEIAGMLEARPTQVKNWLQEARRTMEELYERRCALVRKEGVCHQCAELADYFGGDGENPLAGARSSFDERLRIVEELRHRAPNRWHSALFGLLDEL